MLRAAKSSELYLGGHTNYQAQIEAFVALRAFGILAEGPVWTAWLHGLNPHAWLAGDLGCNADIPQQHLHELLLWHWSRQRNKDPGTARR